MPATELCVIHNPTAGRGRGAARLEELRRELAGRAVFRPTEGPGHAEQLACEAAKAGFAVVGAAGGDGTVHEVANGLLYSSDSRATLAIFPVGSANDYAYSLGLAADWWRRPNEIVRRSVDVGRVTTPDGRRRYFINGLGLGFNCAVTVEARRLRWLQGIPLYSLALLRALRSQYAAPVMDVTLDEAAANGPTLALTLALGAREGSFLLAPNAVLDDERFDFLHVGPLSRWRLLTYLPRMISGRLPQNDPLVRTGRCRLAHIRSASPLLVHCDGEFFCTAEDAVRELEVEVLPRALSVQAPVRGLRFQL